jgi:hypothetical protein
VRGRPARTRAGGARTAQGERSCPVRSPRPLLPHGEQEAFGRPDVPRGACAARRRQKTHTLRRVPAQTALLAVLTPGASSAGNVTVGAPPDGNDPEAAIPPRRGAASSTAARMGTPAPGTRRAGMTGGAAHRSPHGFAQERTEYA